MKNLTILTRVMNVTELVVKLSVSSDEYMKCIVDNFMINVVAMIIDCDDGNTVVENGDLTILTPECMAIEVSQLYSSNKYGILYSSYNLRILHLASNRCTMGSKVILFGEIPKQNADEADRLQISSRYPGRAEGVHCTVSDSNKYSRDNEMSY